MPCISATHWWGQRLWCMYAKDNKDNDDGENEDDDVALALF